MRVSFHEKKVIVVGAGFSGLASAALLAKKGFDVTIVEKNKNLGGRAQTWKTKGFMYDMGPSWYLMPEVFENYYKIFGKKTSDFYKLKQLDPSFRVFYEKEGMVDLPKDKKKVYKLFDSIESGSSKKLKNYLDLAKLKYDIAMEKFLYKEYQTIIDFFTPELITSGLKLQMFESLDSYVSKKFKNHKLKKVLEYSMVFLGGSPKNTPALYSLMSHVDINKGVYYPLGGMVEIVNALEKLCKNNGVKIIKGTEVKKIITNDNTKSRTLCSGILTNKGKKISADIILVSSDYEEAETKLLHKKHSIYSTNYWNKRVMGPSALLFYIGVKGKLKSLKHHNLFLADEWEEHFDQIYKNPTWPTNPSYYVSCPSKSDNSVAPKGKENLFFLIPIANELNDGDKEREKMFKKIINDFEKRTKEKISDKIIVKRIFSQRDFKKEYNSFKGTALGLAHTLFQTAVFRPSHKSKKVKNLYYTGSYTHPGIGVPMVLISAQIVADKIQKENKN
ncbi:MAG TPA: phytoene desaturase family protein [archaeon]|nr:phytoene desaturase family protein [archaeon]